MPIKNLCIRCGEQRVPLKTWEERVGNSVITHTTNVCPDAVCQKIVEEEFAVQKAKSDLLDRKRIQAKEERNKLSVANRKLQRKK